MGSFDALTDPGLQSVRIHTQCFCGRTSDDPDKLGPATCDMSCAGDASETCGGRLAISVYEYTERRTSEYAGCFVDESGLRALSGKSRKGDPNMTREVRKRTTASDHFGGFSA